MKRVLIHGSIDFYVLKNYLCEKDWWVVEHMVFVESSGLASQDNNDTYKEMDGYKLTLVQHNEESATYYN